MEINLENFEEKFGILKESIQTSEFVTFDTEFTGSKLVIEDKPHEFDTFQDKYRKNKLGIEKFMIVQVGITTFRFCAKKNKYIGRPFNILVYPRSIVEEKETHFHVNADTIQFLNRHCFNFNQEFRHGIPYGQLSQKQKIREKCEQFVCKQFNQNKTQRDLVYSEPKQMKRMSHANQQLFSKYLEEIRAFMEKEQQQNTLALEVESAQLRQNLSRELHKLYGFDSFTLDYDLDEPKFHITKTRNDVLPQFELKSNYDHRKEMRFVEDPEAAGTIQQITTKLESVNLEAQIRYETETLLEYEMGFSRVIELIIRAKRPLIGHNMFLDIMFMYQQFIGDLPETLEEFIHNFSFYFPHIYDTKAIAEVMDLFPRTDLNFMSTKCFTDVKFTNYLQFEYDQSNGFDKYLQKTALHEAGYDSYITGVVFASLVKQLELQTFVEFQKMRGRTGGVGCQVLEGQYQAGFQRGGTITSVNSVLSCRTGRDFTVQKPQAKNLVELSNSKLSLGCAVEFYNYVMLAMEGTRSFRFEPHYQKYEEILDHKNVIYVELVPEKRLSAFEFSHTLCEYGDIYVVKDSQHTYFIEFQWVDDVKYPNCKRAQDICQQLMQDQIFGTIQVRDPINGEMKVVNVIERCLTYAESLKHRQSVTE